jgi:6-phosphogluconolactonase (cycloisomerase 2 family)
MNRWSRLVSSGLLFGFVLLSGCGNFFTKPGSGGSGGGGNTDAGDVLYFMNQSPSSGVSSSITAYTVSTTGKLSAISGSPYTLSSLPTAMAITPGNTFLYVAYAEGILGYSIGTNGVLTALNSGAAVSTAQLLPLSMQVDSTGTYLLAASEDLSTTLPEIGVYQIDTATGALTAVTGSPLELAQSGNGSTTGTPANAPNQLYIAPNNSLVYLTLGSGGTEILTFDASTQNLNDTQTYIKLATGGTGQIGVVANAASTVLYVTEIGVGVRAFTIGSNATLTEISGSPYKAGTGPTGLTLGQSGDYLYVANKGDNTITGYTVAASGELTVLGSSPYNTGGQPLSMTLDQSTDFLAVANSTGNPNLGIYSFDTTTAGKLDAVTNTVSTTAAGTTLVVGTH